MACRAMNLAFVTTLVAIFVGTSNAATYTVGDKTGWTIPPSASFYANWVAKQTFNVGDVLAFNFPTGAHTVAEVSKTAYDACNTNNVLSAVKSTAPANYTLSSGGTHYFICTITGHCAAGQKISIPVSATGSSSPPATAPAPASSKKTPSPAPTTSPAPSPSGTTTSPAPSPAKSTVGAPTPVPSQAAPTPAQSPATGTTTSPPSPVGPSPTAGNVPTPDASSPGGATAGGPTATPPPSAAPAVGGFGLLSLFSMVALALF